MRRWRWGAIIVAIGLIVLVAGAVIVAPRSSNRETATRGTSASRSNPTSISDVSPSKDATASVSPAAQTSKLSTSTVRVEDWATCRNDEARYEVQYPKDWYVYGGEEARRYLFPEKETACLGKDVILSSRRLVASEAFLSDGRMREDGTSVVIRINPVSSGATTARAYFERKGLTPARITTIAGTEAYWLRHMEIPPGLNRPLPEVYLVHNGSLYDITAAGVDGDLLDLMLSTLVFTP